MIFWALTRRRQEVRAEADLRAELSRKVLSAAEKTLKPFAARRAAAQ